MVHMAIDFEIVELMALYFPLSYPLVFYIETNRFDISLRKIRLRCIDSVTFSNQNRNQNQIQNQSADRASIKLLMKLPYAIVTKDTKYVFRRRPVN